jgi:hypothetical protein
MKKQNLMAAVAMAATVMVLGAVNSANAANDIRNTVLLPGTPDVQVVDNGGSTGPTRPTLYPESAIELRKRTIYFEEALQILIRHRNEWFAKASNLLRRPQ